MFPPEIIFFSAHRSPFLELITKRIPDVKQTGGSIFFP
jgi:hypothetical protein